MTGIFSKNQCAGGYNAKMNIDINQFSQREKEVIALLLQGKSNKQIALELGIASRTVEFHLGNIYARLGVNTRSEAILKFAGIPLRDSTGGFQVESTADGAGGSTENGFKSILRSIHVKNLYFVIAGLLSILLVAALVILYLSAQDPASRPAEPALLSPAASSPTASVPDPTKTIPPPETAQPAGKLIPPHTVNGITAEIESYHLDTSRILFQVHLSGGDITFGSQYFYGRVSSPELYYEDGGMINSSGGFGPALDPSLVQFEFVPVTLLKSGHLKGQFAFNITAAPDYENILARFRFDFDLPIDLDVRFYPKQAVTANGLEMLLESITVSPTYTQAYLCFPLPSYAPWTIGSRAALEAGEQQASLYTTNLLFSSSTGGDRRAGSEPFWVPPIKNGSCFKIGFQVGSSSAKSLVLTIPELEKADPDILMTTRLAGQYPGMDPKEAYHAYLEELGNVYKGPWVFKIELTP